MQEFATNRDISSAPGFQERRDPSRNAGAPGVERRQFGNNHDGLSPAAKELANAIDEYKLRHRRRFITYEEMMQVVQGLGYHR
ncbi:MAG: hypothetical protein AAGF97_10510 [Planctomycetota bacterium]